MGTWRGHGPGAPGVAALLSLLIPGLGHAWLGAMRRGLLIGAPIVGGLLLVGLIALVDPRGVLEALIHPGVLVGLLIAIPALGTYHLLAIQDAYRLGLRGWGPGGVRSPLLVGALAAAVALYGTLEVVGVRAYEAASAIFVKPDTGFIIPAASFEPSPSSTMPGPTSLVPPEPTATPVPVPAWAADGRLNLLLIGSDAGPSRWLLRTDTVIVLSVDVVTARAALFGIPRNIVNVPLPPESADAFRDGRYPAFLNSLYVYALGHPEHFPGGDAAGFRAVTGAIQELVGVPLDGAIVVNLNGFVDLVDAVGGLWIDIPYAIYDEHYPNPDGSGSQVIYLPDGCHRLDGEKALQYARSRHQSDDYTRMRRQQAVLIALSRQLDPIGLLPKVPKLLEIARDNLWTTIDQNDVANLAVLAARVSASDIVSVQLEPPIYPEYLDTAAIKRARATVRSIFEAPAATSSPAAKSTPKPCPRPNRS